MEVEFKQVYLYDGTPYLVSQNEGGIYQYPDDEWTEIEPPDGIYSPFHFDPLLKEWIGTSREQWLTAIFDEDDDSSIVEADEKDNAIADFTLQLLESEGRINSLEKDVANLTLMLLEADTNA